MSDGWRSMTLGEFVTLQRGHDLPEQERQPGRVPILGSFGVTGFHDKAKARGPGVTVGRSGASFGVACYSAENFWPLNTALYVIDFHGNDPRFAYYFLKAFDFRRYNSGSAQPSLNRNFIHPVRITIPPLAEQRVISMLLGALDDKIELNRQLNETLETTARDLFKSWFIDFDPVRAKIAGRTPTGMDTATAAHIPAVLDETVEGIMPQGWRRGTLEELQANLPNAITAGPFGSKLVRTDYVEAGVPVVRGCNLGTAPGEWFSEDSFVYVSREKVERDLTSCLARPGDVLFTQRGTLGQVGMIPFDAEHTVYVVSQSQMKMTCADWVPPEYVILSFKQPETIAYIHANAVAVGVPHINLGFLRRFPILIPSTEILRSFGGLVRPLQAKARVNLLESRTLAQLRDTLLPKLLSGELRVRDVEREVEKVA